MRSMERERYRSRPSPLKQSPKKPKRTTRVFPVRLHGSMNFSPRGLLRSFFTCYGAGAGDADNRQGKNNDNAIKRPAVSAPFHAKKHKHAKHAPCKVPQEQQHGSTIELSTGFKEGEADDNAEDWQIITEGTLLDTEKQEIEKQEHLLPNVSEPSTIISESLRSLLFPHLPTLVRGREWVLLYSTWKHGISLRTLYRQSLQLSEPSLLAIEDSKGAVFGGLLTGPLNPNAKSKFQGTHGSFVFTNADSNFRLFCSTGLNRYYFLCTNDMLAFGGGRAFALRLDGDLMHGSSGLSETFDNCYLSSTEEFNIRHVELWGFAHRSSYRPEKALLAHQRKL